MPIDKLTISNFKGIAEKHDFEIKPITLFIGPNSSGKSSCIHALAALAQTVKIANSKLPIVLDDEYAQVHLGRFIEVIHSKSYSDSIEIGISLNKSKRSINFPTKDIAIDPDDEIHALYSFKSTKRTQDISMEKAEFVAGTKNFMFKKTKNDYAIRLDSKVLQHRGAHRSGLNFNVTPNIKKEYPEDIKNDLQNEFFNAFLLNEFITQLITEQLQKTLYLGPFRQPPRRRYPTRGSAPLEVGAEGESAVTMLANEYVQSKTRCHIKEVSDWMTELGLAKKIDVSRVSNSDLFDVQVTLNDGASLPIADLGYGLSQILPVLVQCSFAEKGSILLFEQPELHLHHGAARVLASILARISKQKDLRIIAETHSEDLFMQTLVELNNGNIKIEDVVAYEVSRTDGKSKFRKIEINQDGDEFKCTNPWRGGITGV